MNQDAPRKIKIKEKGSGFRSIEQAQLRDQRSQLQKANTVDAIADRVFRLAMESKPMHSHLKRLSNIRLENPVYFITCCSLDRARVLNNPTAHQILVEEWLKGQDRHGWHIGRYVVMPDHIHFFASPDSESKTLSRFMQAWKQWTSKRISKTTQSGPIWQKGFFDHLIRSDENRSSNWEYIRNNPVRAGLVTHPENWPYQGYIRFQ